MYTTFNMEVTMPETLPPNKDAYIESSIQFPEDNAQGYKDLFDEISYTDTETKPDPPEEQK